MTLHPHPSYRVLVSQRVDSWYPTSELRDGLDQRLVDWVVSLGCLPFPVPNGLANPDSEGYKSLATWIDAVRPDAIILSGGNNVGECIERDKTEFYLLDWACQRRIPVLGICRGMQIISVWAGSQLEKVECHVDNRHSLLQNGADDLPAEVNSYHDFAIQYCPKGFAILATSEDGVIEAIAHKSLQWEAWMWHPEREPVFTEVESTRVKKLFGLLT